MRASRWTLLGVVGVLALYAWHVWSRRWIADDGLIVVRTVREILAGHGPTYNIFERAEADTSALWTWLLAAVAFITRADVAHLALLLGAAFSIAGVGIAMAATCRLYRGRGNDGVIVPAGVLIVLAVFPFWDYATSGLETGLCIAWLGAIWWLLVTLAPGRELPTAIVIGLGPLVRPDLGLASVVFLVAAWVIARPSRRRTCALAAAAIALPLAYEVFRAGYYGTLVPLPALAKSASHAAWGRGFRYLLDFSRPYAIWIPLAILALLAGLALYRRLAGRRELVIVLAPVVTGVLMFVYVLRVGGDFMHARMFLAPVFAIALPAFMLPLQRLTAPTLLGLTVWALVIGIRRSDGKSHVTVAPIEDERVGYVHWTHRHHPVDGRPFVRADRPASTAVAAALAHGDRRLLSEDGVSTPLAPGVPASIVFAAGRLGTGGAEVPLDGIVEDTLGLSNPIGARITPTLPGYPGHEKVLPWAWHLAMFGDPASDNDHVAGASAADIHAARHALTCGDLAELLAAAREPLTLTRFWDNLTGSIARTRLVIPANPVEAEAKFCH